MSEELKRTVKVQNSTEGVDKRTETWTLDYTNVSQDELIELAERSVKIILQQKWRDATKANDGRPVDWDGMTFRVREILDGRRQRKTPEQKAREAIEALRKAGLADEELRKLLQV